MGSAQAKRTLSKRFVKKKPEPPRLRAHGGNTQGESTRSAVEQRENGSADHSGQGNEHLRNSGISLELHQLFVCGIGYMPLRSWHVALGRPICARTSLRGVCALGASVLCLRFFTRLLKKHVGIRRIAIQLEKGRLVS